ncbi:class D sortase [Paenibacillus glufosinatiresistens]|uniref:class D sortase n=1 Tax=Paenibacillus glufosinatiresistens TaxID=3070657 RepID=UPI00286E4EA9|nr:class D sortase [Paenibacillus sp. YX.27]
MRKLSYLLIAAGILVLLYPWGNERYNDWRQARLLAEAERSFADADTATPSQGSSDLRSKYEAVSRILQEGELEEPEASPEAASEEHAIGVIEIPSIEVKLPILEGATKANMKHAAAHVAGTAPLGESGNSAVAAHRAHTKGRLFNRLGEVKIGDSIVVKARGQIYSYKVVEIRRVLPTDLRVLEDRGQDSMLTLITCDPMINPTHRLIIHAKMP